MARKAVRGERSLQRKLVSIPAGTNAGLDTVSKTSLEPIRDQTSLNAIRLRQTGRRPPGGHLDQGVVIRKVSGTRLKRTFWVTFVRRARKIAHLVEFGTAPHVQPKRGIIHPGARAKPFMTPAYEARKSDAVRALARETWKLVQKFARGGTR